MAITIKIRNLTSLSIKIMSSISRDVFLLLQILTILTTIFHVSRVIYVLDIAKFVSHS